jgi:hypothetical protein
MPNESTAFAIEAILRSWLDDRDITLFCGDWRHGGVMELLPKGGALLSGRRYDPPFEGLRDLRLEGVGHHVHLDLARLAKAWYIVSPSVCYGFRPSFELRFSTEGARPHDGFGLGVALTNPYAGHNLRASPVRRYLRRAAEHMKHFPVVAGFACETASIDGDSWATWDRVAQLLDEFEELPQALLAELRAAPRGGPKGTAVA